MARQPRTTEEIAQVTSDENRFFLPLASSLDVGEFTVYGTTDPVVDLSMVNIRHLNNTRSFRGPWVPTPTDGVAPDSVPTPYLENQVVIGPDNHLYRRNDIDPTTNPNPMTDNNVHWVLLSSGLDAAVTELTSSPSTDAQNLYAAGSTTFTVSPNANATLNSPTQVLTATGTTGASNNTAIAADGTFTVNFDAQTNPDATIVVTTASESSTTENGETITHEGGQVDSTVVFQDGRIGNEPTVLPDSDQRVSIFTTTETVTYNVNLLPNSATLAAGTAYDSGWRTRRGTTVSPINNRSAAAPITPLPLTSEAITFEFPLNTSTIQQVGAPANEVRMVNVYTPWYYQFTETVPTDLSGATIALRQGETQPDDFTTSDFVGAIAGPTGRAATLYLFVDSAITGNITLINGISNNEGMRMTNTITVPTRDPGRMVTYTLHKFRLGLVGSPTNFTITTN